MRVLICPDGFKGCLDAPGVTASVRRGVMRSGEHEIDEAPISDGGESFTQALAHGRPLRTETVTGSHGQAVGAPWCAIDGTAYFTVADIVGHGFVPVEKRDPGALTTRGIGEMLLALARHGQQRIVVGLGGSGTVDGGVGLAHALGFGFRTIEPLGNVLPDLESIEQPAVHPLDGIEILAAHDVDNPLTGPDGAARVFGPQKGASPEQVERLDAGLTNLHRLCDEAGLTDGTDHPGDGAAGGLGFGLRVFAGARLVRGAEVVIGALDLRRRIAESDLVITGEGRLDSQSCSGKAAWAVGRLAGELGVPSVCVAGTLGHGWEEAARAFTRVVRATPEGVDESEGIARAEELIERAVSSLPEFTDRR